MPGVEIALWPSKWYISDKCVEWRVYLRLQSPILVSTADEIQQSDHNPSKLGI
jgi:hypothetical protein